MTTPNRITGLQTGKIGSFQFRLAGLSTGSAPGRTTTVRGVSHASAAAVMRLVRHEVTQPATDICILQKLAADVRSGSAAGRLEPGLSNGTGPTRERNRGMEGGAAKRRSAAASSDGKATARQTETPQSRRLGQLRPAPSMDTTARRQFIATVTHGETGRRLKHGQKISKLSGVIAVLPRRLYLMVRPRL